MRFHITFGVIIGISLLLTAFFFRFLISPVVAAILTGSAIRLVVVPQLFKEYFEKLPLELHNRRMEDVAILFLIFGIASVVGGLMLKIYIFDWLSISTFCITTGILLIVHKSMYTVLPDSLNDQEDKKH